MSETYKHGDRIKITIEGTVENRYLSDAAEEDSISIKIATGDVVSVDIRDEYLDDLDIVRVKPDLKAQLSALDPGTAVFIKTGIDSGFTYLIDIKPDGDKVIRNQFGGDFTIAHLDNDRIHEVRVLT